MNITLRQLRVFSAVTRHLSFTRAAEELCLTQPAVSMQVKQLESQLDVHLFEHVGKKVFLTETGAEIYRYSRSILQQIDELQSVLNSMKGLDRGRLKISVASTANYFIPVLLASFCQRHPNITVGLDVTNRETLLNQLAENEVDLVVMGQPPNDVELGFEPFLENPLVIVAPPNHPLAHKKEIPLETLKQEIFLVREPGSGTRIAMERFFAEHGIQITTGMEVGSNEAIKQSVQASLGLGLLSRDTVEMELALDRLCILQVNEFPIMRHWYVVHRRGKRLSSIALAFKEFLLAEGASLLGKEKQNLPEASIKKKKTRG